MAHVIGSLSEDQRQRLAALYATREALVSLNIDDVWDTIRCAHWVWCAEELEVAGYPPKMDSEHPHPDAARWRPAVLD